MDPSIVALVIVVSLLILLFTGLPIAFSLLGISSLLLLIFMGPQSMLIAIASCFKQLETEVFLAVPLYVFMAAILQFSGIAESLYHSMHMWMGPLRGGLLMGTVVISAIIAALTGIGATATVTMGLIALPEMLQRGYDKKMCLGGIAMGGALGPLIPPSVLMVIVAGYSNLSVGKMFLGGYLPGVLWTGLACLYIGIKCYYNPSSGPPLPREERGTPSEKVKQLRGAILPVGLIVFIMGGIYAGIFTPTEAAGFGALAAIVISIIHRRFSFTSLNNALQMTLKATSMIIWLVMGGGCYSALITITGTGAALQGFLQGLPFGKLGVVIVMNIIVLIMGMFIDPIAITMICVPVFIPVCNALSVDLLWFMILFCANCIVGYITPPFGLNLFYMKGVAPQGTTMAEVYRGVIPFAIAGVVMLAACIIFPPLISWLPSLLK